MADVVVHRPDPALLNGADLDLWVACTWDTRPARGLFDRCDWRLDGLLERWLRAGRIELAPGARCLVGASRRLGGARLLVVGLGSPEAREAVTPSLARSLAEQARSLGAKRPALEVPRGLDEAAARRFVERGWKREAPGDAVHIIRSEPGEAAA